MPNITILIDGTDYTSSVRFPEGFSVTYAIDNSSKTVNVGISSGILFERESFEYLENKFFPTPFNPGAKDREAAITISEDCCNQSYDFIIRADATTYCPQECTIETQGFERSDDFIASGLLNGTYAEWQQEAGDDLQPSIRACTEFGFVQAIFVALLAPVGATLGILIQLFNLLGLDDAADQLEEIFQNATGCNKFIESVYVRDFLRKNCDAVGLQFVSSIFDGGVYRSAAWIDANESMVSDETDLNGATLGACTGNTRVFSELTIAGVLDVLARTFNGDYRIQNGVLRFERRDFFIQQTNVLVNVDDAYNEGLAENAPCYTYTDQTKYANGLFRYEKDTLDGEGNASRLTYYYDRIEFNDPIDPNKAGTLDVVAPIGSPRFVGDGFGNYLDAFRPQGQILIDGQAWSSRTLPKIIIVRPRNQNDLFFCNALPVLRTNSVTGDLEFNFPMWFREDAEQPELYNNFWSIEDPRTTPNQPYQLEDFEFIATCEQIQAIRDNGIDIVVETRLGNGTPEEIVINYETKTITVKGTKLAQ